MPWLGQMKTFQYPELHLVHDTESDHMRIIKFHLRIIKFGTLLDLRTLNCTFG